MFTDVYKWEQRYYGKNGTHDKRQLAGDTPVTPTLPLVMMAAVVLVVILVKST
jgi:hypothetical protein